MYTQTDTPGAAPAQDGVRRLLLPVEFDGLVELYNSTTHGCQRHWNIGGSQVERRRRENRGAVGLGRGCAPSQKIYEFFFSKWCDMAHSGCVVLKIHVSDGL